MKEMTFTQRLNIAMKMRGLTQASLAEAASMAQPSVWKLTSGKAKSTKKILEIAAALSVDPTWLATGKGEKPNFIREEKSSDINSEVLKSNESIVTDVYANELQNIDYEDFEEEHETITVNRREKTLIDIFSSLPDKEQDEFMKSITDKKNELDRIVREMLEKRSKSKRAS